MMKAKVLFLSFLVFLLIISSSLATEYGVSIDIQPKEITVRPGGIATYDIEIKNLGELEDTYSVVVEGIPEDWFTLSEELITLPPGESGMVYLFITPYPYAEEFGLFEASVSALGLSQATANFTLNVVPDHVIEVTIPKELRVCRGEESEMTALLKNTGNHTEEVVLSISGTASGFISVPEESMIIEPGEEVEVTLVLSPIDVEFGEYVLEVQAQSITSYARDSALSVIEVTKCYDVEVTFPEEVKACAGKVKKFELTVKNIGLKNDTYELNIPDLNYSITIVLQPDEFRTLELEFLREEEGIYETSFTVESEFVKKEGTIKFVVELCYGVDLTVEEKEIEIESGRGRLVKAFVKNIGTMTDTFSIISDVIWSSIRPEKVTLESNQTKNVYAYYSPEFGAMGNYTVKLTAQSPNSQDTEEILIRVLPKEEIPETTTTTTTTVENITTTTEAEIVPEENITTTTEETTTTQETTTQPEVIEETTTTTVTPSIEIPTGEIVRGILENRAIRSLLIAIIIVLIILIIIYLVVMR
jgi:hypothetical protein